MALLLCPIHANKSWTRSFFSCDGGWYKVEPNCFNTKYSLLFTVSLASNIYYTYKGVPQTTKHAGELCINCDKISSHNTELSQTCLICLNFTSVWIFLGSCSDCSILSSQASLIFFSICLINQWNNSSSTGQNNFL